MTLFTKPNIAVVVSDRQTVASVAGPDWPITMTAFAELRDFARDTIPALLLEAGGQMDKQQMHARVEHLFIGDRLWPEELNRIQKGGCTARRNAIAWAMADLVMDGSLSPSIGQPVVRLAGLDMAPPKARPAAAPNAASTHEARVTARALERARACRGRAHKERVPFDEAFVAATADEIKRQDYRCAATGIPFDLDEIGEGAGASHFAPSPDRIVPSRGYVPGNVRWVLWMVNRAKSRMTEAQFLKMCQAIAARN